MTHPIVRVFHYQHMQHTYAEKPLEATTTWFRGKTTSFSKSTLSLIGGDIGHGLQYGTSQDVFEIYLYVR